MEEVQRWATWNGAGLGSNATAEVSRNGPAGVVAVAAAEDLKRSNHVHGGGGSAAFGYFFSSEDQEREGRRKALQQREQQQQDQKQQKQQVGFRSVPCPSVCALYVCLYVKGFVKPLQRLQGGGG